MLLVKLSRGKEKILHIERGGNAGNYKNIYLKNNWIVPAELRVRNGLCY